jgi:signal transduction histidine kinase
VARIVDRHGGHVRADATANGTGATITIVLPALDTN